MKFIKSNFALILILSALVALQACKAKKLAQKPKPVTETETTQPVTQPVQPAKPAPAQQTQPVAVEKPNYNFSNIQFEFNSSILTTDSYPLLDKAAAAMKMDPSAKFTLNGYASAEGTPEHNMTLSQDRANSVKVYLLNAGVNAANLTTHGYGESNPVADNTTEEGRILNRRVELHKQ
jgi:OmpA-OmpF porin, OOP family